MSPGLQDYFIYLIPAVTVAFDVARSFISGGVGSAEMGLLSLYVIILTVFVFKDVISFDPWTYLFFAYIIMIGLYSSSRSTTYKSMAFVIISMSMLPLGYAYIKDIYQFKKLNLSIIAVLVLFALNAIVCAALGIGENPYGGSLRMGAFIYAILYSGSIAILLLPLVFPVTKGVFWKIVTAFFSLIVWVFLVLSMRRTAMGVPIIGFLILLFIHQNTKGSFLLLHLCRLLYW
ncbi:MAG: hypothetical protein HC896_14125 [Bacteroidales bacterium]|nr:hypothetical protein [Bacteroidales bacterium]